VSVGLGDLIAGAYTPIGLVQGASNLM
jgi:hypothetical protein